MAELDRQVAGDHGADAAIGEQPAARSLDPPSLSLYGSAEPRAGRAPEGASRAKHRRAGAPRDPDHHQRHFRRLAQQWLESCYLVIAGLDPAIHLLLLRRGWMPGSSPGMTIAASRPL